MKNKEIKQYLLQVKSFLPPEYPDKKQFIAGLEFNIRRFTDNHPNATLSDLYEVFGTPRSVAEKCGFVRVSTDVKYKTPVIKYVLFIIISLIILCVALAFIFRFDEFLKDFAAKL